MSARYHNLYYGTGTIAPKMLQEEGIKCFITILIAVVAAVAVVALADAVPVAAGVAAPTVSSV